MRSTSQTCSLTPEIMDKVNSKFYGVGCSGMPVTLSLMGRAKASTLTHSHRRAALEAIYDGNASLTSELKKVMLHLHDIERFIAVEDEAQDLFFGPHTQRITYHMPEYTMVPCFTTLQDGLYDISVPGSLLSIGDITLIARVELKVKITTVIEKDALLIFRERPNDCVAAFIPPKDISKQSLATKSGVGTSHSNQGSPGK
ncbi:TPA_asm: M [Chrysanthemum alphacytorhabdovirus 1]|nr:TPA_asm: M [Chrysanthemum alphacytorhabdovirus 1]